MTDTEQKALALVNCRECANCRLFRSKCRAGLYQQRIGWGGMSQCRSYVSARGGRVVFGEE